MVDRVLDALVESRIETTHTIVSPHATRTRERLAARANDSPSLSIVDAPGNGYVADLQYAMGTVGAGGAPLLTVAADLPLLDGAAVNAVLDAARTADGDSLTVCVPAARKRELGVSADATTEIDGREVVRPGSTSWAGATHPNGTTARIRPPTTAAPSTSPTTPDSPSTSTTRRTCGPQSGY